MKKHLLTAVLLSCVVSSGFAQDNYILNESFDNNETVRTTALPQGWSRIDQYDGNDDRYRWAVYYNKQANTMTGQHYLGVGAPTYENEKNPDGQGPRVEKVITPELDLNDSYQLSFQWEAAAASSLRDKEYNFEVHVLDVATNSETTIFNSSNVDDVRNSGVLADPNTPTYIWPNWGVNTSTLDLSAYKGKKVKIVFVYNLTAVKGNVLYLDEVKVKQGAAPTGPIAKLDQTSYNFGKMYIGEKVYSSTMNLTNTGVSQLKVTGFEAPEGIGLNMNTESVSLSKNEKAQFQLYYKAALSTPVEGDAVIKTNGGDVTVHYKATKEIVPDGYQLELFEQFPPAGWTSKGWYQTGYALEGDLSAVSGVSIDNCYLVSPRLDLSDATRPHKVMFTYYSNFTSEDGDSYPNNDLSLAVSTDGGNTWAKEDSIWTSDYTRNNEILNITVDLSRYTSDNVKLRWCNSAVGYDTEMGAYEAATYYLDRVLLPCVYGADGVPMASEAVTPEDKAVNIYPKNVVFTWKPAQFAEGYKVYIGKSATSFDVVNGEDVKEATTYTQPSLDYATTYFWKIVPYNKVGDATDTPVSSFTTQADQTISTFPWFEGFEGTDFPPLGWFTETTGAGKWSTNNYHAYDGKTSASATGRAKGEKMSLVTPEIKLPADKDMQVSFWWGNDMGVNLKKDAGNVRTNTTTGNDGIDAGFFEVYADGEWKQITMISEPDADNRYWVRERFDLKPYAGKTIQLRWRYEMYSYNKAHGVSVDNIEISDANATNVTIGTSGWFAGKVNYNKSATSADITLSNFGGSDISVTNVSFSTDHFKSTLAAGDKIEAGKTKNFTVTFNALTVATKDSVTINDKMVITLSDNSKLELPVEGIALAEDILHFDFETDKTGEVPAGFTGIDEDGRNTMHPYFWDWPNMGGKFSFFVINDSECLDQLKGASGHQSLMSVVSADEELIAKDWIVSQKLEINENSKFDFDARNWQSINSVLPQNNPKVSVWVSETSNTDISTFTQVGKTKEVPLYDEKAWTHFSYDLSSYAGKKVYVALKSEANNGLISFYDNFEYSHIKADLSGIGSVVADGLAGQYVQVYNMGGMKVAEGNNALETLPAGIYIVKTGTQTVKVVKR